MIGKVMYAISALKTKMNKKIGTIQRSDTKKRTESGISGKSI
jgi:hypothetical protein